MNKGLFGHHLDFTKTQTELQSCIQLHPSQPPHPHPRLSGRFWWGEAPSWGAGKVRGDARKCCVHFLVIKRVFLDSIKSSSSKQQRFPRGTGSSRPPEPVPAPAHVRGTGNSGSWKFRNFWKCEDFKQYVKPLFAEHAIQCIFKALLYCLHPNFVY